MQSPIRFAPSLRDSFDYADYSLYPQDYHAIYITLDKDNDTLIYVCSQIINLEKTQSWDFVEIAKNTYKDLSTPTFKLQQFPVLIVFHAHYQHKPRRKIPL